MSGHWEWQGQGVKTRAKYVEEYTSNIKIVKCRKCQGIATALYMLTNAPTHDMKCDWWSQRDCSCGARFLRFKMNLCSKCALSTDEWRRQARLPDGKTIWMRFVVRIKVVGDPDPSFTQARARVKRTKQGTSLQEASRSRGTLARRSVVQTSAIPSVSMVRAMSAAEVTARLAKLGVSV